MRAGLSLTGAGYQPDALLLITLSYVVGGLLLGLLMFLTAEIITAKSRAERGTVAGHQIGSYEINTSSVLVPLGIVARSA